MRLVEVEVPEKEVNFPTRRFFCMKRSVVVFVTLGLMTGLIGCGNSSREISDPTTTPTKTRTAPSQPIPTPKIVPEETGSETETGSTEKFTWTYGFRAFDDTISPTEAIDLMASMPPFEYDSECKKYYDRTKWEHPVRVGNFINIRHNELNRESLVPVTLDENRRKVIKGEWQLVYTTGTTTNPGALEAEHVIPLANANCIMYSMGLDFNEEIKKKFYNDINLVLMVDKEENKDRGAASWAESPYDDDGWFPPNPASHCGWISLQIQVRDEYGLGITDKERLIATNVLEGCVQ